MPSHVSQVNASRGGLEAVRDGQSSPGPIPGEVVSGWTSARATSPKEKWNPYAPPMSGGDEPGSVWQKFKVVVSHSTVVITPPFFGVAYLSETYPETAWLDALTGLMGLLLCAWGICQLIVGVCCLLHRILRLARFIISSIHICGRLIRNAYRRVKLSSRHRVPYFQTPRVKT